MGLKLYNCTSVPNEAIQAVLQIAKRLAGVKGNVIVKIDSRRGGGGYAMEATSVQRRFLINGRKKSASRNVRRVATDGGYTVITFARNTHEGGIWAARAFFETAIHEFAHIRDFQNGAAFVHYAPGSRKQLPHRKRVHEIRAENAVYDAKARLGRDHGLASTVEALLVRLGAELVALDERCWKLRQRAFHYNHCRGEWNCFYCKELAKGRAETTASRVRASSQLDIGSVSAFADGSL